MKTVKSWLWLTPLLLLIALIIQAPARLIQWLVPEQLALQAGHYHGSLWNGRATQVVVGANGAYIAVDTLHWQLQPLSLLLFSPAADIQLQVQQHGQPAQELRGLFHWLGGERWQASDLEITVPAVVVGHFAGAYQLSGQLSLRLAELEAEGDRIEHIDGDVSWQNARWNNGDKWLDFGSLAGELSKQSADIQLKLFDLSGPLEIDGQLLLKADKTVDVKGVVGLRPQAQQEFSQFLPLFAERQPDGKYKIDFQY